MILKEQKIELKNGKTAVLKSPSVEDAEKLLRCVKQACGETNYLLRSPEEWDGTTVEEEQQWIESANVSPNDMVISCYIDGEVVGNCDLRFFTLTKARHRASLGISILRDYWGLGIGSSMFEQMINAARARGVEIMELEFIEGNHRARGLYEKYGFQVVSEKPNAFKLKDGTYLKEFYMQKYL